MKAPVLLHYAENDLYFNAQTSRLWYEHFAASGALAEYVQPPFGRDGHYIFSEVLGVRYWLPAVEQFLASTASRSSASTSRSRSSPWTACRTCAPTPAAASTAPSSKRPPRAPTP